MVTQGSVDPLPCSAEKPLSEEENEQRRLSL
jgi:hypothetical protein